MENTVNATMHTVYFLDADGRLIDPPVRVVHGAAAAPPAYIPRAGDVFLKWSRDLSCVTENTYCVAVTRAMTAKEKQEKETREKAEAAKEAAAARCRVHVLDLRQPQSSLLPLGNWSVGGALTRTDLECLHLRRLHTLPAFRLQMSVDTLLVLTAAGTSAFDMAMRPLEMLTLLPEREPAWSSLHTAAETDAESALLRKEA